jgi:transcriptional regulator with XRE-family HTH domain
MPTMVNQKEIGAQDQKAAAPSAGDAVEAADSMRPADGTAPAPALANGPANGAPHDAHEELDDSFGMRMRMRRQQIGMSLTDLAALTDLSASFLSLVERNLSRPSFESLRRIADALDVPPFGLSQEKSANPVVRHNERIQISFPPGDVVSELLVPNLRNKLEVFISHVKPSAGNVARKPLANSEECLLVLEGTVRVVLNGMEHLLQPGDSIYIHGSGLSEISAAGDADATFLSAITPPIF